MIRGADLSSATREEFAKWLVRSVTGVSPALARKLSLLSGADEEWAGAADALMGAIESYRKKEFTPAWVLGAGRRSCRVERGSESQAAMRPSYRAFDSMNEAADAFFGTAG